MWKFRKLVMVKNLDLRDKNVNLTGVDGHQPTRHPRPGPHATW